MPPCPIIPPPTFWVVPWPWQAPLNWGGCVLLFLTFSWAGVKMYRREGRPLLQANQRRIVGFGIVLSYALPLFANSCSLLLAFSAIDRITAWHESEFDRFYGQQCSLDHFSTIWYQAFTTNSYFIWFALGSVVLSFSVFLPIITFLARRWKKQQAIETLAIAE